MTDRPASTFDDRFTRLLLFGATGVAVICVCVCGLLYRQTYLDHVASRRREAERTLQSLAANASRLFDYADTYVRAVRMAYLDDGAHWRRFADDIGAPGARKFSGALNILDARGRLVYHGGLGGQQIRSSEHFDQTDHFSALRTRGGDTLFIGPTRRGLLMDDMQFRVARPLLRDGAFDGDVFLTLRPESLVDFYRSMSLGPHSSVSVLTLDGHLIAREPAPAPQDYGRALPALAAAGIDLSQGGSGEREGVVDPYGSGGRRDVDLYYARLPNYPVAVMVAVSRADLAAGMVEARRSLIALASMVLAGDVLVYALLLRMRRQTLRLRDLLAENRAAQVELRIAATAFESREAMLIADSRGVVMRVNKAFTDSTGYAAEDIIGRTPALLKSGRHDAAFYAAMWRQLIDTGAWQGEIWDRRKNGEEFPKWLTISAVKDADGLVTHYVGTHFDITERKRAEARIEDLAFYDQLTGLPNRTLLLDRLRQSQAESARSGRYGALLFIDLDRFKALNDTLGHGYGDMLLQQVAGRLQDCVRASDTAARLGGDEFVVLLRDLGSVRAEAAAQAEMVGEKIVEALNQPYRLDAHEYHSTPSIGIALYCDGGASRDDVLKQADIAMYQAKAAGRNALRFFDPEMQAGVNARVALEHDLRAAMRLKEFSLHFQPQVDADGRCVGAEALLRWRHPLRGMIAPDLFIPLAEETGLILDLGRWVLDTACAQLAAWSRSEALRGLTLAVNVSARQLHHKHFVADVAEALRRSGADPRHLKLELTESLLLTDTEETIAKMRALRDMGVGFVLDDFGTGYSSLSYLQRLPLETLKIDRSFVSEMLTDVNAAAIARTVIALAQALQLRAVAEGVETEAQRQELARLGCRWYQGYLFARPLTEEAFAAYIG